MASFIARAILWLIFAFFLFETVKEFNKLFSLSINPYLAIIPVVLMYGFQEFMVKKKKAYGETESTNNIIEARFGRVFYVMSGIFVIVFLLFIVLVWAGVIYKSITD